MASDTQMEAAMKIAQECQFADFDPEALIAGLNRCWCRYCRLHLIAEVIAGMQASGFKITRAQETTTPAKEQSK